MKPSQLPTEVELAYEVMPCLAMRTGQEPLGAPHPCGYFRKWGTYHSYDYAEAGPPPAPGIVHETAYVGRAPLVPELLSGCRKAPILAVGINPNLPGWWGNRRNSLSPLFDEVKQYAHYFRYRAIDKLEIPKTNYEAMGGGAADTPFSTLELNVTPDGEGRRIIPTKLQPQSMYEAYQSLLDGLAEERGWTGHKLAVGEDVAYGNMVACPSAKWSTVPTTEFPAMTEPERKGIVGECFHERKYFLRQLFQSLPQVVLIFSQATANAFIAELQSRFVSGDPAPGMSLAKLMERHVRLQYGVLGDGTSLEARVIFAPHATGNPADFAVARAKVIAQLVEEAEAGRLGFNAATGHLRRARGACVFCPMLEIGPCDYEAELEPLTDAPSLTADSSTADIANEKLVQLGLLNLSPPERAFEAGWADIEDERKDPGSS
jgi:hypothetical protein